ncbi:hypothetical protein CGCSCA5_v011718 [Colletotrichum siamense]|nr:hypothetical protein CGCSCA5_v011718 [Colletotrichum siamense]
MGHHRGRKTASAGAVAAASFTTAFIDPTGISLLTFLGASTATVIGSTYHAVKGVSKAMVEHREKRAYEQALALRMSPQQHMRFQQEVEHTLRRLTSSLEGTFVSGVLFIGLPYMGITWAINVKDTGSQIKRLKTLADRAGGKRALVRSVSKRNAVAQVAAGAVVKTAVLSVTLGHDFDAALDSIAGHVDDVDYKEMFLDTGAEHEEWLKHSVVEETTDLVDKPSEAMKKMLEGFEGDFDGQTQAWSWEEGHSAVDVAALGAVVAVVDKAVDRAADDPAHKGIDRATGIAAKRYRGY